MHDVCWVLGAVSFPPGDGFGWRQPRLHETQVILMHLPGSLGSRFDAQGIVGEVAPQLVDGLVENPAGLE